MVWFRNISQKAIAIARDANTKRHIINYFTFFLFIVAAPTLHFLQVYFLSRMNQIPREGSSLASTEFNVPIEFDMRTLGTSKQSGSSSFAVSQTASDGAMFVIPQAFSEMSFDSSVQYLLGTSGQNQMWVKRKFFHCLSVSAGVSGSLILIKQLSALRKVLTSGSNKILVGVNDRMLYFRSAAIVTVAAGLCFLGVHVAMLVTDRSKMLTKELLAMTATVVLTTIIYLTAVVGIMLPIVYACSKRLIRSFYQEYSQSFVRVAKANARRFVLGIVLVFTTAALIRLSRDGASLLQYGGDDIIYNYEFAPEWQNDGWSLSSHFFYSVTGGSFDACRAHGLGRFRASIRYGISWPNYLPRRLLNFFTGSESCDYNGESAYNQRALKYLPLPAVPTLAEKRNLLDFDVEIPSPAAISENMAHASKISSAIDPSTPSEIPVARRKIFPLPGRKFSNYDRKTFELLVPVECPDHKGKRPVIIIEDLNRNHMGNNFKEILPEGLQREFKPFAKAWPPAIMKKYIPLCNNVTWSSKGQPSLQGDIGANCTIHWKTSRAGQIVLERVVQHIHSGSVVYQPHHAPAKAFRANVIRNAQGVNVELPVPSMPFPHVRLPLLSEGVSIFCGFDEEFHVHPVFDPTPVSQSSSDGAPPRNVLIMLLDAVSRQEMPRSLPLTTAFLQWHRDQYSGFSTVKGASVVPIREWKGYTTVGHSTLMNFGPLFGGNFMNHQREAAKELSRNNIFSLAKEKYGNNVFTSLVSGTCAHTSDSLANSNARDEENGFSATKGSKLLGGAGGPLAFTDKDQFASMCHVDYGGLEGNFQGPYSIKRRCIGNRHVHDHVLEYTEDLIAATLFSNDQGGHSAIKNLLHISYFLEGHEGTHAVIGLVDLSLYRFLRKLETTYMFFSDPRNLIVLLSDHGNHMGPYFEWSSIGDAERRTPPLILLGEPISTDSQRDSEIASAESVTTPFDLYLTFCDILRIKCPNIIASRARSFLHHDWSSKQPGENVRSRRKSCRDSDATEHCILSLCEK